MATKRAQELIRTISTDVKLRQSLENAESPEQRRTVINKAGFADVKSEEIKAALKEDAGDGELSDAELESVAGGRTSIWISIIVALAVAA